MEILPKKELIELFRSGTAGSRGAFTLAAGKLVGKLKSHDLALAQELSKFLEASNGLRSAEVAALPVDPDSRQALVEREYPVRLDGPLVLPAQLEERLSHVVLEWENLDVLLQEGLAPARMLLFCGEPGVGKTLAAHWLAQQMDLPLLTLNLASVMSSFLGKTGNNIRAVFDYAMKTPCVLLLDEFDAIAKRRGDDSDIGELKRLVNVLLQALDDWPVNSMLIAATNHGELLDPAVWRRFDHVLQFDKPDRRMIAQYLCAAQIPSAEASKLAPLMEGESFSAIRQLIQGARKRALFDKKDLVESLTRLTVQHRIGQGSASKADEAQMLLLYLDGHSLRDIGARFKKSHPTVGKIVKQYLGD